MRPQIALKYSRLTISEAEFASFSNKVNTIFSEVLCWYSELQGAEGETIIRAKLKEPIKLTDLKKKLVCDELYS